MTMNELSVFNTYVSIKYLVYKKYLPKHIKRYY